MNATQKIVNAYTIGDVVFSVDWISDDDTKVWIKVRYAGYSADGSLFFHWTRGGTYYSGAAPVRMPHSLPTTEMRIEIAAMQQSIAVATWRSGPGDNDTLTVFYALGQRGELLEIEPPSEVKLQARDYGFRAKQ